MIAPASMLPWMLATHAGRRPALIGPNARLRRSSSASMSSCGPSGRISKPLRCSPELLHDLVRDRVVRVDVLHVVRVLEGLDQAEHLAGVVLVKVDLDRRQERPLGR